MAQDLSREAAPGRQQVHDEAARTGQRPDPLDPDDDSTLPFFEEEAVASITTVERCPSEALGLVDVGYRRLLANVVLYSLPEAWDDTSGAGPIDPATARARAQGQLAPGSGRRPTSLHSAAHNTRDSVRDSMRGPAPPAPR